MKLTETIQTFDHAILQISKGIHSNHNSSMVQLGINSLLTTFSSIKTEVSHKFNGSIPVGYIEPFRLIDYILNRLNTWIENDELSGNLDAEIFLDSLHNQQNELKELFSELNESS